jgi:hypothetical protein
MNPMQSAETEKTEFERRLGDGPWANGWCPTWESTQDPTSVAGSSGVGIEFTSERGMRIGLGSSRGQPTVGANWDQLR